MSIRLFLSKFFIKNFGGEKVMSWYIQNSQGEKKNVYQNSAINVKGNITGWKEKSLDSNSKLYEEIKISVKKTTGQL